MGPPGLVDFLMFLNFKKYLSDLGFLSCPDVMPIPIDQASMNNTLKRFIDMVSLVDPAR